MKSLSNILAGIYSKQDMVSALSCIDEMESNLYKNLSTDNADQSMEWSDNPELPSLIISTLKESSDKKTDLKELREAIKKLRVLRLTLAVQPTAKMIKRIGEWVKQNLAEDVIADWVIDRSVMGGAGVSFNGRYGDYSLNSKILKWWDGQLEELRKDMVI